MYRDHLSLKMRRELADRDADVRELTLDLVAVGLAVVGEIEIEETRVRGRDLDGLVAVVLRPAGDALERIVRRRIPRELRQKQARPLDGPHDAFSRSRVGAVALLVVADNVSTLGGIVAMEPRLSIRGAVTRRIAA